MFGKMNLWKYYSYVNIKPNFNWIKYLNVKEKTKNM